MNSCHDHNFTVAGTVYTTSGGSTPAAGATVTVIDAKNNKTNLVVQSNGNFYGSPLVTFPLTVYASSCPTLTPMTATVASNDLSVAVGCNNTSCHASGGNPGVMHLP
jgi:hypothetical protein